jgi:hypothetical protein
MGECPCFDAMRGISRLGWNISVTRVGDRRAPHGDHVWTCQGCLTVYTLSVASAAHTVTAAPQLVLT